MKARLWRLFQANAAILVNAGSLLGTRVVTAGLGFVYWWLAARLFEPEAVGLASAAVSAMMLLGTVGVLGMDTLLIGELPRRPNETGSLIVTALLIAGGASLVLGLLFGVFAPYLSDELTPLANNGVRLVLFAAGVMLTTITLVLDQALIGLLHGQTQLWRNVIFASLKLGVLFAVGLWLTDDLGMMIYATWVLGNIVSLGYVAVSGISTRIKANGYRPQWGALRDLQGPALRHYMLNMSLQVPVFALPVLVTVLLSTATTASFYAVWMITSFLFTMPHALTTVLYAVGAADPSLLAEKMRFTLRLSFLMGMLGAAVLVVGAYPIMHFFGKTYAEQASSSLRILALGIFPTVLKAHFVAINQIFGRMLDAAKLMAIGGVIELTLATAGARIDGQFGLSLGWAIAIGIEGIMVAPLVYRTATSNRSRLTEAEQPG